MNFWTFLDRNTGEIIFILFLLIATGALAGRVQFGPGCSLQSGSQ